MKSFLQTQEWLDFQKHVGRKTRRFDDGKIKANIIRHDLPFGKNYLYIPHGPEISFDDISGGIKNELSQFVAYLKNIAREERSIFIKIEPLDDKVLELIHSFGFKKSSKEIQPHRSVVIDLEKSEEELLSMMHHKTRYNIKVAEKYGLKFVVGNNLDVFWRLLKHTAKNDNFSTHPKEYYQKLCSIPHQANPLTANTIGGGLGAGQAPGLMAEMVFIKHKEVSVAGALLLASGDTVYYLHGAMDRGDKYKPMMAPYKLHWEVIKWAKGYGMKHYDLWGIDANRWPGVTRFKLGWGGRQVEYPGSFDLPVSKIWYLIYKIARKIF